jgi:hypothetical protein
MSADNRKLYRVTVEVEYYALTETADQAEAWAGEAIGDMYGLHDYALAVRTSDASDVHDYEPGELVYHDGADDISIEQAMAIAFGTGDPETQAPPTGEATP